MSLKRTQKPAVMHAVGHQTPAVAHMIATKGGTTGAAPRARRARRARSTTSGSAKRKRRKSTSSRPAKGSAAAKAWGAKMRRLRKKKA